MQSKLKMQFHPFSKRVMCLWPLAVVAPACLTIIACSARSKTIVYDEPFARSTGKANLICTPEVRETCRKDVELEEAQYVSRIVADFRTISECRGLTFIVDQGVDQNTKETKERLAKAEAQSYWSLQVEFHYKLTDQVASMGLNRSKTKYGLNGGDVQLLKFACQIAQDNGIHDSW